jgi:predicted SAM-dependent methyltransferase
MKLNLGCGNDIRQGYVNIDLNVDDKRVIKGDVSNLDTFSLTNDSVDEIIAIDIIQYFSYQQIVGVVSNWCQKLKPGGSIYIESVDYNMLSNMMFYDLLASEVVNNVLYGDSGIKGIYNLPSIEALLKNNQLIIDTKGFKDAKFYIRAIKQ